jgi:RNA polymerase sigma-70 factor (ECF subfamily)
MTEPETQTLWMDEPRERALVRAARGGDRQAFLALVAHYHRLVYRLSYALTRDHRHAADLAHESLQRAWSGMRGMPEGKRFIPWLLRITRNLSLSHARRRAGEPTPVTALRAAAVDPGSEAGGTARQILDALHELRPDEQMALALRTVEGLPYEEIARLLDHPVGHTLARLSTARGFLLERLPHGEADA